MRHRVSGRKLNRNSNHRKALNKFMATSFIENGKMTTTLAKAKYVQPFIESLVTLAKAKDLNSLRELKRSLNSQTSYDRILKNVSQVFTDRVGGYTRIVKLSERVGDNAPMVRIEWTEEYKEPIKAKKTVAKKETAKKGEVKKEVEEEED